MQIKQLYTKVIAEFLNFETSYGTGARIKHAAILQLYTEMSTKHLARVTDCCRTKGQVLTENIDFLGCERNAIKDELMKLPADVFCCRN